MTGDHVGDNTQGERIARLEVAQEAAADAMKEAFNNLSLEVRAMSAKLDGLPVLQHAQEATQVTVDDLKDQVTALRSDMARGLADIETSQGQKWNDHDHDSHATNRKIAWFSGVVAAFLLLGSTIVGGAMFMLNYRFDEGKDTNEKQDVEIQYNRSKIDRLTEKQHQLELIQAQQARTATPTVTGSDQ